MIKLVVFPFPNRETFLGANWAGFVLFEIIFYVLFSTIGQKGVRKISIDGSLKVILQLAEESPLLLVSFFIKIVQGILCLRLALLSACTLLFWFLFEIKRHKNQNSNPHEHGTLNYLSFDVLYLNKHLNIINYKCFLGNRFRNESKPEKTNQLLKKSKNCPRKEYA